MHQRGHPKAAAASAAYATEPGECGGLYTDGKGKIINYVGPETECVWTFKLDPDLKAMVGFPFFKFEGAPKNCEKEYVEVIDGPPGSKSLGRMCNAYSTFIASSSNIITVKYSRIPSHPPSFFEVYYFPKSY
ncbi:carbohydrate-binding protein AQN-1-like isoform X2 [Lemur catta]|uniref:carbohydrate-binding protein AQN-1-like isoform X2 n=1 Tax=Lemur catta TaxID=9447 RepID=UPI001E26AD4F|nr:carbohydrate-binding protein AQN-1-like isoform X2 [Lemur catta]